MPEKSPQISSANFTFHPLMWLAVCFAAGIFLQSRIGISLPLLIIICLCSIAAVIFFIRRRFAVFFILTAFTALGALFVEIENQTIKPNRLRILYDSEKVISGNPVEISGVLLGKPELAVGGFFLTLNAESLKLDETRREVSGKIRLFAPITDEQTATEYENLNLGYGSRISAACELKREDKFRNPGVVSGRQILDQQNIDATCFIKSPLLVEKLPPETVFAPVAWIYEQRQNLIIEFKKHFSVLTAGVLIASLLGNRYHLDKTTSEVFREGGTFHILIISGLQITFIGGLIILIFRRITRRRFLQFLLASLCLWSYALAVGADAPVLRAALMFTILHFAYVIFRQENLINALGASAFILLVIKPSDIFNQSFQLTFMCVLAIVAMAFPLLERLRAIGEWSPSAEMPVPPNVAKRLKSFCEMVYWSETNWQKELAQSIWQCQLFKNANAEKLERRKLQKPLRYIFETLLVSIIVQLWLLPFSIIYFHRISLVSVFLNVWVGLLMAIESLTALVGIFIAQINGIFAAPFIWLTEILNWTILNFSSLFVENNWANLRLPHYAGNGKAIYFLYFIPIIGLTILLHKWKPFALIQSENQKAENRFSSLKLGAMLKISFLVFAFLLAVIVFHPLSAPQVDGNFSAEFLDVGQGDSILLTMPTGETLLVDGGGRPTFNNLYVSREDEEPELFEPDAQNIGETVVSRFLWEKGYDKIDYLLATHADTDHIQGLSDVAGNFKIDSAIVGRTPFKDEDFAAFATILEKNKIPPIVVSRGDVLNFGDAKIEVLYPPKDFSETVSENNSSIVLRIIYGNVKLLLTGDIEKEAEAELLNSAEFLQANVVKVAHHGSRTSSTQEFVNAVKAKVAVISVGRESPFGHPKPEIVERWKNSGAKVLTTGENGTITISTDGKTLKMKTYAK